MPKQLSGSVSGRLVEGVRRTFDFPARPATVEGVDASGRPLVIRFELQGGSINGVPCTDDEADAATELIAGDQQITWPLPTR